MELKLIKTNVQSLLNSSQKLSAKFGVSSNHGQSKKAVDSSEILYESSTNDKTLGGGDNLSESKIHEITSCSSFFASFNESLSTTSFLSECRSTVEIKRTYNKLMTDLIKIKWELESNLLAYDRLISAQNRKAAEAECKTCNHNKRNLER